DGNILLTIGSRELAKYCEDEFLKERLIVRIIPDAEGLSVCSDLGIKGKNIIAIQGLFTQAMNEAMIDMYQIKFIVSKMSGTTGGFEDKLHAAKVKDIPIYAVGNKANDEEGVTSEEILKYFGVAPARRITLAGVGMGNINMVTAEVQKAVKDADLLLGAERLIDIFKDSVAKKEKMYLSKDIIPYIQEHPEYRNIVILFSGDSGFYSGAKKLYEALGRSTNEGKIANENADDRVEGSEEKTTDVVISILPGISSVSALAARLKVNYDDAMILSMHGKEIHNLAEKIRYNKKIFLLLSGKEDVRRIGRELINAELDVQIFAASSLSYENEQIAALSPQECISFETEGPVTLFIKNDGAVKKVLTPGMANEDFIREKVPMTKEEVREISLCKLRLTEDSVLYDIGSGTGSVTTEAARLSDSIFVYAIERKEDAYLLTQKNLAKYHLDNLQVIKGEAPEAMKGLKPATHAFIGGSGGNLKEIIRSLYEINPTMRVVINAVSIETISELKEVLKMPNVKNADVVLAQFSHGKTLLDYTLMSADNPVWICSFDLCEPAENNPEK
ncbi:MAG: precorrin-6Y C5,15-methyltransferase (decarboxylating) subunit CbiT, partial [Lachnospiraceae bacterium]|nr:precorrin-6Y C5,15-methyltransferase (decarboxylating) subunit CbiT [Lachnospiraceae bacterium]